MPPPKVVSAAFFRLECSHEQLFQPEYKRSNRTKGVKILRCFPHCCPDHVDRSYCGCSLSVRVELAPQASNVDDDTLALFARFEALSDVSLKPGECVQVDKMAAATQCEGNPEAQWVAGSLDQPSRLVAAIRAPDTPSDTLKSLGFHLNHKTFARWYYDWESGANKAQRLMKHVFKAYVVQQCAVDQDDNFVAVDSPGAQTQFYRVLHVVTSPEFTVISYRRSQAEQYQLSPHEIPDQEANQDGRSWYDEEYFLTGGSPRMERPQHMPPPDAGPASVDGRVKLEHMSPPAHPKAIDTSNLLEDKLRWEYTNLATVAISRNLALVYSFLRWAPLNAYASFVDELVHLLHHSLQVSLSVSSNQISRLNCFAKLVFGQVQADESTAVASSFVHGRRAPGGAPTALPREMETLLYTLMQVTLWFFSTETRQWMRMFFQQHTQAVTDKHALRASFVFFLQQLEDRLDTQVLQRTALRSLDNLAEEVIGAVYSYEYFHVRRPQVREILSGQHFMGWSAFVAQICETYISVSSHRGVPREQAHPPRNDIERAWNAEWLMDVDEAVWKFHENVEKAGFSDTTFARAGLDSGAVSLFTVFELISQLVRVEIALDVQERTLHVRSHLGVAGSLDCMRLVLDHKERVLSMFPNGMASAIDPRANGDYIGEMQVDESGRLVVYLQVFTWATREDDLSYRVRVRIECWRSQRLCISGDVLVTSAPSSFTSDEMPFVGEMSLRNKREAVERAFVQQLRENPSAKWAAPWRELGRFRLSYLK
jgi:hypothetical protein